jgi:YD repeat-containing protein
VLGYYLNGQLNTVTDPNTFTTTYTRDLEGRLTQVTDPLGHVVRLWNYTGGRVASDESVQAYTYYDDDTIASITYKPSTPPTPTVNFYYDTAYRRLDKVVSSTSSEIYTYNSALSSPPVTAGSKVAGANKLQSIQTTFANATADQDEVTYTYDMLDRVSTRVVAHVANASGSISDAQTESFTYNDVLGRVTSIGNQLDTFNYSYAGPTSRISSLASTYGPQIGVSYSEANRPHLVSNLNASTPSGANILLSQYEYYPNDQVQFYSESEYQNSGASLNSKFWEYSCDTWNQLSGATQTVGSSSSFTYPHDLNGNWGGSGYSYASDNEITSCKRWVR